MLILNTSGSLERKTGKDLYAQHSYSAPVTVQCSIVHLATNIKVTTARADSSASRGNAEEEISTSKILFPPATVISDEDKFTINGIILRVIGVEIRRDVFGVTDHLEVDFGMWQR